MMDMQQFQAWLAANPQRVLDAVEPVVKKAALNVKNEWRDRSKVSAGAHAQRYPYTIRFDDPERDGGEIVADVYPDRDTNGQANLAPILEFGTVNNPPHGDLIAAADKERKQFGRWVAKAVGEAWRD